MAPIFQAGNYEKLEVCFYFLVNITNIIFMNLPLLSQEKKSVRCSILYTIFENLKAI